MDTANHEAHSIYERVCRKVADREGKDPTALPPIHNVIDPEALDRIFDTTQNGQSRHGTVEFEYNGYLVTVHSTDEIEVSAEPQPELS